ncbi:toprim domain-containing protein [Burkholderia glumae]|uniref:toprim domain-containing protein n=1 Tax=Burkholderia glumae TaxID=337 RepID=UPI00203715D7|nr:toprim domain-containing protein [Burkholderia glumae]MCM2544865.1 toprim domain-containing protein [Burkholderia glumae]
MEFADFAESHGLIIRSLVADGRPHRVPTVDHPRKRNGAYLYDGHTGWVQNWAVHEAAIAFRRDRDAMRPVEVPRRDIAAERLRDAARRAAAAREAGEILARCETDRHPYLAAKGFPGERGMIDRDGRLVVPMRDADDYARVNSIQWINDAGEKKFLPGGTAKGSIFVMGADVGARGEHWFVEGYATGLSVRDALRSMYRPARVVVCFSAGNLQHVTGSYRGRRYVVADNDVSGTGARVAAATGLPWGMPPVEGDDANDMHQRSGLRALAALLRDIMSGVS